jgi:hypothetical protein
MYRASLARMDALYPKAWAVARAESFGYVSASGGGSSVKSAMKR